MASFIATSFHYYVNSIRFHLVSLLLVWSIIGQTQIRQLQIDSLKSQLTTEFAKRKIIEIKLALATLLMDSDSISTVRYANDAKDLAHEIGYIGGTVLPLYPIGVVTLHKGNYVSAYQIFTQMLDLAKSKNLPEAETKALYGLGWLSAYSGEYDQALEYLNNSLHISTSIGDQVTSASSYKFIGIISDRQGDYSEGLNYYYKALAIYEELHDQAGIASCYFNIGLFQKNQGEYERALEYYQKAFEINKDLGIKREMAININAIGYTHLLQGNPEKAIECYLISLKLKKELGDNRGLTFSYRSIGIAQIEMGMYEEALENFNNALAILADMGAASEKIPIIIQIGKTYRKQNKLLKAKLYLQQGIDLAQQIGRLNLIQKGAEQLALTKESLGDYQGAYHAHVLFKQITDSLYNEESLKKIMLLEAEYDFQKERDSLNFIQQQEVLLLNEKAKRTANQKQFIYISIGIMMLLFGLFCFNQIKQNQKENLRLLRNRISRDLHDEIGSTLSSIALVSTVADKFITKDPRQASQHLKTINDNSVKTIESMNDIVWTINSENDSMLHLINRMRSFASDLESTREWDVTIDYDSTILDIQLNIIQRRNIYLIFKEAVNNSVKYSEGTTIHTKIHATNNTLNVTIKDNGKGFNVDNPKIMMGGNGLKNMELRANELGGYLEIDSSPNTGVKIVLTFDLKKDLPFRWKQLSQIFSPDKKRN